MAAAATVKALGIALLLAAYATAARAADAVQEPVYGAELQGFTYPWPVAHFRFNSQGEALDMAYLDVTPKEPNGQVVVLLHGKNFCAATWQATITVLADAGYPVIAADHNGFFKTHQTN